MGSEGLITERAMAYAKRYLPFTADSVPALERRRALFVDVTPMTPQTMGSRFVAPPLLEYIVFQPHLTTEQAKAVHPVVFAARPAEGLMVDGVEWPTVQLRAAFDPTVLPLGMLDLVIVTKKSEVRVTIRPEERRYLR